MKHWSNGAGLSSNQRMQRVKEAERDAESGGKQEVKQTERQAEKQGRGTARKSRRRLARELALQGLYQWCVAGGSAGTIEAQFRDTEEFPKTDEEYFSRLLRGVLTQAPELEKEIQPCLDRPFNELSPVEISILLLGTYELERHPEIPYRAVINEAVELAKAYGGTHGHKYVNGVLDKLAVKLRAAEIGAKL